MQCHRLLPLLCSMLPHSPFDQEERHALNKLCWMLQGPCAEPQAGCAISPTPGSEICTSKCHSASLQLCCRRCAKRQGASRRGWQVSRGGFCELPRCSGSSGGHPVPQWQSHRRQAAARQPADQQDALRPFSQHIRNSRLLSQFQERMRLEPTSHTQRVPLHSLRTSRKYAMPQALASILPGHLVPCYLSFSALLKSQQRHRTV